MAFLCASVILGGNKPLEVEVISSADLAFGVVVLMPTCPNVKTDKKSESKVLK